MKSADLVLRSIFIVLCGGILSIVASADDPFDGAVIEEAPELDAFERIFEKELENDRDHFGNRFFPTTVGKRFNFYLRMLNERSLMEGRDTNLKSCLRLLVFSSRGYLVSFQFKEQEGIGSSWEYAKLGIHENGFPITAERKVHYSEEKSHRELWRIGRMPLVWMPFEKRKVEIAQGIMSGGSTWILESFDGREYRSAVFESPDVIKWDKDIFEGEFGRDRRITLILKVREHFLRALELPDQFAAIAPFEER